ncbi:hypothetical protein [Chitinimonas sp.]|uniref:hypothetical protein n=1 Tax=Chitinimonas sp. TaxID=1934313 RepID=UPI0035B1945F
MRISRLLLAMLISVPALAEPKPATVKLCQGDQESGAWVSKDRPSYVSLMIKMATEPLGAHVVLAVKPWKRCLSELQNNVVDGVVNISYLPEREAIGVFPVSSGQADQSRRMHKASYSLYRLKDSAIAWNGKQFSHVSGTIGAQNSFSIVTQLRDAGLKVDDSTKSAEDLMRYLTLGNFEAIALHTNSGDLILAQRPELAALVERLPVPLAEKSYYLVFSKSFYKRYPQFANHVWDRIATVRDSAEFNRQFNELQNKP